MIQAVTTPLSFMVLGFLIVDGSVGILAVSLPDHRTPLVYTLIASVPGFIALVAAMAIWRPEALSGNRPLGELYGRQFANELVLALDGSLRNLTLRDRNDAWMAVASMLPTHSTSDHTYRRFCVEVALQLTRITNLPSGPRPHGPEGSSK